MSLTLIAIFVLSLFGLICLLSIRGPLVRASEDRHGLAGLREALKQARADRVAERARMSELATKLRNLRASIGEIDAEIRIIEGQLAKLPKQTFELTFEIGAPDAATQCFEFIVSRVKRGEATAMKGPERDLWERPRLLRVWNRAQGGALAQAQARFTASDGFLVRVAERVAGRASE